MAPARESIGAAGIESGLRARGDEDGRAQAVGPVSLKRTVTFMITGVGTPFTSVGV